MCSQRKQTEIPHSLVTHSFLEASMEQTLSDSSSFSILSELQYTSALQGGEAEAQAH